MKLLHLVLCAAFISAISLPMFGMQDRVVMDDDAERARQIAIIDTCTCAGQTICGVGCPLVACCALRGNLEVAIHFTMIGVAAGHVAGLTVAGLTICAARGRQKND